MKLMWVRIIAMGIFLAGYFSSAGHMAMAASATRSAHLPSCEDLQYTQAEVQAAVDKAFKRMEAEGYKVTPLLWEDEKGWAKVIKYATDTLKCDPRKSGTKSLAQIVKIVSLPCPLTVKQVREVCRLDPKLVVIKNEKECKIETAKHEVVVVEYDQQVYGGDFKKLIQERTMNGQFSYQQIPGLGDQAMISGGIPIRRAPKQAEALLREYEENSFSLAIVKGQVVHTFDAYGPKLLQIFLHRPMQGCSINEVKTLAKGILKLSRDTLLPAHKE